MVNPGFSPDPGPLRGPPLSSPSLQRDAAIASKNRKDEADFAASDCKARWTWWTAEGRDPTDLGILMVISGILMVI